MNVLSDFVVANGIGSYAQGLKTVKEAIAKNKNVVFIPATENMPARIEMDNENVFFNEYTDADTADVANVVAGSGATADETQPSSIITTSDLEQELMKQQPGSAKAEAIIAKLKREIPGYVRPEGF